MNKNVMAILLSFVFIISLCSASNVDISNRDKLSVDIINQYETGNGETKTALKSKIIENVFNSIGKSEQIPLVDTTNLSILYGDVVGDKQKDVIVILNISPKNAIVVVYEKVDDGYKYIGIVDNFFDIKAIQLLSVGDNKKNLIIVREYADQMLGAFETSVFLRAYKWENNKFQLVLNVIENYKSYWNELWDNNKPKEQSHWLLVKQQASSKWKNNELYISQKQEYQKSKNTNAVNIPDDKDFDTLKQRDISQIYYWSDKWQHFILAEGTELKTGENIAILEDMSDTAFSLVQENDKYRIKRQNGSIEFVDKNNIVKK